MTMTGKTPMNHRDMSENSSQSDGGETMDNHGVRPFSRRGEAMDNRGVRPFSRRGEAMDNRGVRPFSRRGEAMDNRGVRPFSRRGEAMDNRGVRPLTRRGIVLVACVGILGVLSVVGFAFATIMRLERKSARNYLDAVRAEFVANAAIEDAIARLRIMARMGTEESYKNGKPAAWQTWRGTMGGDKLSYQAQMNANFWDDNDPEGDVNDADDPEVTVGYTDWLPGQVPNTIDTYSLKIVDAASKININAGDNLATILDNLCRVIGPPLVAAEQRRLIPRDFAKAIKGDYIPYGLDVETNPDIFFEIDPTTKRPICVDGDGDGVAVFGDGYAIAGFRARNGAFSSVEDLRRALTWTHRGGLREVADTLQEEMEIEAKLAALRPYVTVDSWTDTDQIGYGKFEHIQIENGNAWALTDRNASWIIRRNSDNPSTKIPSETNVIDGVKYAGELKNCYVAIMSGVGEGQLKTIAGNSIDTIYLDASQVTDSLMSVPPTKFSSYIIIGSNSFSPTTTANARLYARQPLSIHRAPVNVNTARDKVLVSLLMGLQTSWGRAGYKRKADPNERDHGGWFSKTVLKHNLWAHENWACPSILSLGRDKYNANLVFNNQCPRGIPCEFCCFGNIDEDASSLSKEGYVNEAHLIAWQIMKEREQVKGGVGKAGTDRYRHDAANGSGSFTGWDDLFFRVFWPYELHAEDQLAEELVDNMRSIKKAREKRSNKPVISDHMDRHYFPGLAKLCMANFNSNADILKFQPNLEWIDRWGANFTDLYQPYPSTSDTAVHRITISPRPGELLDKTDLNIGTTEFCFSSQGIFEIEAVGRVYEGQRVLAESKVSTLVRIYDVWRESTQREFSAGTISRLGERKGALNISLAEPSSSGGTARDLRRRRMAGQYSAHEVDLTNATPDTGYETAPGEPLPLCTYPEPLLPEDFRLADGHLARTVEKSTYPASFDGQILLSTNRRVGVDYNKSGYSFSKESYNTPTPASPANIIIRTSPRYSTNPDADGAPCISFYHSFSGDVVPDFCRGNPRPGQSKDKTYMSTLAYLDAPDGWEGSYEEKDHMLDEVSILGALDSSEVDILYTPHDRIGIDGKKQAVDGKGKRGDFRPDGVHFGAAGEEGERYDGAIEFAWENNMLEREGSITFWLKPMWQHGNITPASLPLNYTDRYLESMSDTEQRTSERGSTVCMINYQQEDAQRPWYKYWYHDDQTYKNEKSVGAEAISYTRDRFEYQLFSLGWDHGGYGEKFHFRKTGDREMTKDNEARAMPFYSMSWGGDFGYQNAWYRGEDFCFLLGGIMPEGHPYWRAVPFRWHFMGSYYNADFQDDDNGRIPTDLYNRTYHGRYIPNTKPDTTAKRWAGQPAEHFMILFNDGYENHANNLRPNSHGVGTLSNPGLLNGDGNYVYGHQQDYTSSINALLVARTRIAMDSMVTFGYTPSNNYDQRGKPITEPDNRCYYLQKRENAEINYNSHYPSKRENQTAYDIEDWAFEQYATFIGTSYGFDGGSGFNDGPIRWPTFGVNIRMRSTLTYYTSPYAVMDDLLLSSYSGNPMILDDDNYNWPLIEWMVGRYYYAEEEDDKARFTSQTLLQSENSQSDKFSATQATQQIELCTVRWTTFTPLFCVETRPVEVISKYGAEFTGYTYFPPTYFIHPQGARTDPTSSSRIKGRFEQTLRFAPEQFRLEKDMAEGSTSGPLVGVMKDVIPSGDINRGIIKEIKEHGLLSRASPLRGCRMQIEGIGDEVYPRDANAASKARYEGEISFPNGYSKYAEYADPESDVEIIADYDTRQHVKCTPEELRYRVIFRLSELENDILKDSLDNVSKPATKFKNRKAALVDSPVLDDVTITYMGRPQVLQWRNILE